MVNIEKKVRLQRFKKCFNQMVDSHLEKNDNIFKKDIRNITRICLKRAQFKNV